MNTYQLALKLAFVLKTLPDVVLPETRSCAYEIVHQSEIVLSLFLLGLQRLAIFVNDA